MAEPERTFAALLDNKALQRQTEGGTPLHLPEKDARVLYQALGDFLNEPRYSIGYNEQDVLEVWDELRAEGATSAELSKEEAVNLLCQALKHFDLNYELVSIFIRDTLKDSLELEAKDA